jgi:hypothetical protein
VKALCAGIGRPGKHPVLRQKEAGEYR